MSAKITSKNAYDTRELIKNGVKNTVSNPKIYKDFLNFSSLFPDETFENQMLVYQQRKDATHVAALTEWNEVGRKVNKTSVPIQILKEKSNSSDSTYLVNVYDVKDTSGVPITTKNVFPGNVKLEELAKKTFLYILNDFRRDLPVEMNNAYKREGNGHYSRLQKKIEINSEIDLEEQLKVLIREYANSIFYNETGKYRDLNHKTKELQAESVAYVTLKHLNIDTSDYSFTYMKDWSVEYKDKLLLSMQEDIQKESAKLIKKMENVIKDRNITFEVPVILDSTTTSVEEGERPLTLVQYGNSYTIAKGKFNDSTLNNIEDVKKLSLTFKDKLMAQKYFETMKGHIPFQSADKIDKEKGNTHLYEKTLLDTSDQREKPMYFVGIASFTNIKIVSKPSSDKKLALNTFKRISQSLGEKEKLEKDLSLRDLDQDGLTDLQEKRLGTNPINPDTDVYPVIERV